MGSKFHDKVGYSIDNVETSPGVIESIVEERLHNGDIRRLGLNASLSGGIHNDLTLTHQFSIMADPFSLENANSIVYIRWHGVAWSVKQIIIERPRIILRTGGVYHGPTA